MVRPEGMVSRAEVSGGIHGQGWGVVGEPSHGPQLPRRTPIKVFEDGQITLAVLRPLSWQVPCGPSRGRCPTGKLEPDVLKISKEINGNKTLG